MIFLINVLITAVWFRSQKIRAIEKILLNGLKIFQVIAFLRTSRRIAESVRLHFEP